MDIRRASGATERMYRKATSFWPGRKSGTITVLVVQLEVGENGMLLEHLQNLWQEGTSFSVKAVPSANALTTPLAPMKFVSVRRRMSAAAAKVRGREDTPAVCPPWPGKSAARSPASGGCFCRIA